MSSPPNEKLHIWKDIAEAIINKDKNPQRYRRIFIGGIESPLSSSDTESRDELMYQPNQREVKNYLLGEPFSDAYFTKREAECMMLIMQGYTNTQVAQLLSLSSRTVEFYIKNMRRKTGCESKADLMNAIAKTDFLDKLDFTMEDLF